VARYELDAARDQAIFGLKKVNDISQPVTSAGSIYIFKLEEISQSQPIPADRLATIRSTGFPRWLDELKARFQIWVDPQFKSTTATA
jgi:parvulin-like peptidyl-prolyl isomerase